MVLVMSADQPKPKAAAQRSSLGLIVLWQLFQEPRHVYAITDSCRDAARDWLREMLRSTGGDYPDFIAAVSIVFGLAPDDAREQLELRADRLAAELADV